ncbi:unnamed protein product [Sympodiomycopsis kandeliae]
MTSTSSPSSPAGPLFLGLDLSTQALKASLLDSSLNLLSEVAVNFDKELPQYGTKGGVLLGPSGSGQVYSPILLAVEAFDRLAEQIEAAKWPVEKIAAVSGSGQQHASVYWSRQASGLIDSKNLDVKKSLITQIDSRAFSRSIVPNWQDSSTTSECQAIESALGGADSLAKITGSRAYERFTGPQIMKFRKESPEEYADTDRISLVSSFVTTMLCLDGEIKGIDESDACGMNIWDLSVPQRGWNPKIVETISGGSTEELLRKLGRVESDGGRVVGQIGGYWQRRLGFSPDCIVIPSTGDNPSTLLSFALNPKEALVSLGTSDTLLIPTPYYNTSSAYHVFYHPARVAAPNATETNSITAAELEDGVSTANQYFNMLVYKNGSLARESIRDQYNHKSWDEFDSQVRNAWPTSPSWRPEQLGFYWLKAEIIPSNAQGIHFYRRDNNDYTRVDSFSNDNLHAPTIISSQLLSFRSRVGSILGVEEGSDLSSYLTRIHASGGASSNSTLLQTMSDVLGCEMVKPSSSAEKGNACSMGAAYKAFWAYQRVNVKGRENVSFEECISAARSGDGVKVLAKPDERRHTAWEGVLPEWNVLEERALRGV